MKTKLCALLLTVSMGLAALTGCGTGGASSSAPASAPEASVPTATEEPNEAPAVQTPEEAASAEENSVQKPASQEEGVSKYVTPDNIEELISDRPSVALPISEAGTTFTFWTGSPLWMRPSPAGMIPPQYRNWKSAPGFILIILRSLLRRQSESLNLMFASGDYPDILNYAITGSYSIPYLIENEIVTDLQDMMEDYAPSYMALMEADPALYLATVDDEGQIGGLAGYRYNAFSTTGAIVRADWVEKVGMMPEKLVTIDDYHEYLSQVKNQGLCEYPMPLRYDASITGSPFLAAMGGYAGPAAESSPQSFYYDDNDELVYSFITDTYKDYLSLMADWYQEGLITRDLLNSDMLDSSAITSGSYAVFWQDCQFMSMWTEAGKVNDPDYTLAGVTEPLVEAGQQVGFADITDISINLMICTSCSDPETALQWLDYHFSEDGSILCQYGLEGEGLVYTDGKPGYSELISNNPDGLSTDNALNAYTINMNMFASNGTTLRKAYDDVQQKALDAWNDKREVTKSSFTNLFTLNADETATVQRYYTDISTYVAEQVGKFLIGELDIDENWDTFVETIDSMGIDEVIDAYTSAGERYFGRLD